MTSNYFCLEMLIPFAKLCENKPLKQNMEKVIHLKMFMPYLKYLLIYSTIVLYKFMVLRGGADKAVQDEKKWFLLQGQKGLGKYELVNTM